MSYDWLLEPISDDAPCGPDLAEADDEAFVEYYYDAEGRLPERYFVPGMKSLSGEDGHDKVFDPKSVDHKAEKKQVDALLKRSRDVRLLSVGARFQCLAGRLADTAASVAGIADLLETFPVEVHPSASKSAVDRRSTLEELDNVVTFGTPLHYMPLTPDRAVNYRAYLVASRQSEPRSGEQAGDVNELTKALAHPGIRDDVTAAHQHLTTIATALGRIAASCKALETPFTVDFSRTLRTITDIQGFIRMGRSDLTLWSEDAPAGQPTPPEEVPAAVEASTSDEAPLQPTAVPQAPVAAGGTVQIDNHAAARAALEAAERYFAAHEPSSATLLLVTQSRLLIGRPLVEALETLLPEDAKRAIIDFGPETGFSLSMDRLRSLSSERAGGAASAASDQPVPEFTITSRADVARHVVGVEEFFRRKEPTSPIPVLLQRARSYLEKDFHALVAELIPVQNKT